MSKGKPLSVRMRRFVDAYLGSCAGNGTRAAITAGYSRRGADVAAVRLLGNASVRKAIKERLKRDTDDAIASADERDRLLSEAMRAHGEEWLVRIRAIAELNKVTGRHSTTLNVKGTLRLEDALQQSRDA
jgi:phage terminase small subunit